MSNESPPSLAIPWSMRKIRGRSRKPFVGDKCSNNQALQNSQHYLRLGGLLGINFPCVTNRLIDAILFCGGAIDVYDDGFVPEYSLLRLVAFDDLIRMHQSPVIGFPTAYRIRSLRVSVYQRSLDLECSPLIQAMPMNYVGHLETSKPDVPDALKFIGECVRIAPQLTLHMSENAIPGSFANVEGFAVPRIDQSVDVILEPIGYFVCEHPASFLRPNQNYREL